MPYFFTSVHHTVDAYENKELAHEDVTLATNASSVEPLHLQDNLLDRFIILPEVESFDQWLRFALFPDFKKRKALLFFFPFTTLNLSLTALMHAHITLVLALTPVSFCLRLN